MIKLTRQEAIAQGLKYCYGSLCKKHPEMDGYRRVCGSCVECARNRIRNTRANDPEKYKQEMQKSNAKVALKRKTDPEAKAAKLITDKIYRAENKQKFRESIVAWSKNNPDKVKLYAKRTKQKNSGTVNKLTAERRAAKLQRTPSWLTEDDVWMIGQAYDLAAVRSKMFGFSWHVDHTIPLQGKNVSGLHVPENLQVIPGVENVRKSNRYEVVT
jgi:hypothetical protein